MKRPILTLILLLSTVVHSQDLNLFSSRDTRTVDSEIKKFMRKYKIPGLSITLSNQGRVILSKGYGYSNVERKIAVTSDHKFRIASLSKPITSVVIMHLIEQNKLTLEDQVFGQNGILDYPVNNPNTLKVTVRHLLEHSAGKEWSNEKSDPMFWHLELKKDNLIEWALRKFQLSTLPGQSYHYSNFGYCLLGKIIEKKTGSNYANYVSLFLKKNEINNIEMGSKIISNGESEVRYYSQNKKFNPYSFPIARMDAHGGWIASTKSLVKLLLKVDGKNNPKDIITAGSIKKMTSPSKTNKNYALGWAVNRHNNWWHTGNLTGSGAVMVRSNDGMCWAILVNSKSEKSNFFRDLDELPWEILKKIKKLPR